MRKRLEVEKKVYTPKHVEHLIHCIKGLSYLKFDQTFFKTPPIKAKIYNISKYCTLLRNKSFSGRLLSYEYTIQLSTLENSNKIKTLYKQENYHLLSERIISP